MFRQSILLFSFLVSVSATAADSWTVEKLFKLVAVKNDIQYQFSEVRKMNFLQKPMRLRGLLIYEKPDIVEKRVTHPEPQRFRIKGNTLTIHKPGKKIRKILLSNYPELQVLGESLRAALSGQLKVLRKYYSLELKGSQQEWILTLTPTDIDITEKVDYIEIQGSQAKLTRILVKKADGDQSVLTVSVK